MSEQNVERLIRERDLYRQLAHDYAWAIWCTEMACDPEGCDMARCLPGLQCRPCVETMIRGHCMVDSDARNEMMPLGYYQRIEATLRALREVHGLPTGTAEETTPDYTGVAEALASMPDVWYCNELDELCAWDAPEDTDDEA